MFLRPRYSLIATTAVAAMLSLSAFANDDNIKFEGGIGVDPVAGIVPAGQDRAGAPVSNIVRGVDPGGRPWVIRSLKADVHTDGRISVRGEGLLLSGGDGIGTVGAVRQVVATLFCGAAAAALPAHSAPATLEPDGDFRIEGRLDANPPQPCATPVLLIRNVGADGRPGAWFAAGIPKH